MRLKFSHLAVPVMAFLTLSACAPASMSGMLSTSTSAARPDLSSFSGTWEGHVLRRDADDLNVVYSLNLNNYGNPVVGRIGYQNCLADLVSPVLSGSVLTLTEQVIQGPCLGGSFRLYLLEGGQELAYVGYQGSNGQPVSGRPNTFGYLDRQ
ncbi:hypothetical protein MF271_03640 [Deinococcus sp. KNUC1210]|uniref:hypothetical protein n=1 Tax=Deinococcus sp. KNUC1210 TaxID=2917691 RepID=UPI001EF12ABC|nr:hypothetical protein [Deinococcus sp. KNUC1210]ULH15743.1 hypothetical protein MF271_03640 [Deinococcus sp. KNUC1210]